MEYKVIVSSTASRQIEEDLDYIFKISNDLKTVRNWANAIEEGIRSLDLFPKRYSLCGLKALKEKGIRSLTVKRRIVYYEVNEERKTVTVCAVVYAKRDQEVALSEIGQ